MAHGKINPENYDSLKLCWSREKVTEAALKGGKLEYGVEELMRAPWIEFEDIMVAVCNTEVIDADVLYTYAGTAARDLLPIVKRAFPDETIFAEAVAVSLEGNATEKAETNTKVGRAMGRLFNNDLDATVQHALQGLQACVHRDPGSAALATSINAAAAHGNTKAAKREQKELMRTVFRDSEVMKWNS
jgi:hypothetical protein